MLVRLFGRIGRCGSWGHFDPSYRCCVGLERLETGVRHRCLVCRDVAAQCVDASTRLMASHAPAL